MYEPRTYSELFKLRVKEETLTGIFAACIPHFQGVVLITIYARYVIGDVSILGMPTDMMLNTLAMVYGLLPLFAVKSSPSLLLQSYLEIGRRPILLFGGALIAGANIFAFMCSLIAGTVRDSYSTIVVVSMMAVSTIIYYAVSSNVLRYTCVRREIVALCMRLRYSRNAASPLPCLATRSWECSFGWFSPRSTAAASTQPTSFSWGRSARCPYGYEIAGGVLL